MATGLGAAVASFWSSSCPRPYALLACVPLVPPLLATYCFRTLVWMPRALPLASGNFCSRSTALDGGNPAGQRRVRVATTTATPQVSAACRRRLQSDFNPVSTSCGYRVSCAETLGVDGFLARRAARTQSAGLVHAWFLAAVDPKHR